MAQENNDKPTGKYLAGLSLAAIGVVYGDIGTSVLYAFRESFHPEYGLAATPANVLGILSLILWSITLVVSIKYMVFVLRADLEGEGGILVLTALVTPHGEETGKRRWLLILVGLFGAALLYGDSTITPAISVLSAVEGLEVATTFFEPYILPITIGILVALFYFQYHGTARIGKVFGSVMLVWFLTLAALGISQIAQAPAVLRAVNPFYAVDFFARNGLTAFLVLGSVVLAVTGAEALYADIGHFGTRPIRLMWFGLVMPALLLNYFGQGALLLNHPEAAPNPFFRMAPEWALYPLVAIATAAAVIASQSVITGAFSLTRQAVKFGDLPRFNIEQTSTKEVGQVYVPGVNWAMMLVTIGLVVGFGSSSDLAAAYGVAITATMVITTILFADVMRTRWQWSLPVVILLTAGFLAFDLAFFGANIPKIPDGGWFPLVLAGIILVLMTTWKRGRAILGERIRAGELPLETFLADVGTFAEVEASRVKRVEGTAVFMHSNPGGTPPALLHNIKHNRVVHEEVVILSVQTDEERPRVPEAERVDVEVLGKEFYRVIMRSGFAEEIDVPDVLAQVDEPGLELNPMETTYFLGSEHILTSEGEHKDMPRWRDRLFGLMARNQRRATDFFNLPPDRVVELGAQVEL